MLFYLSSRTCSGMSRSNPESYLYLPASHLFVWILSFENTLLPRNIRQGERVSPLLFSPFLPLSSSISKFSPEPRPQTYGWPGCWLAQWNSFTTLGFNFLIFALENITHMLTFPSQNVYTPHTHARTHTDFPSGSEVNNLPAMQEMWVWSLGWKDPLEEGIAAHPSILAWRSP